MIIASGLLYYFQQRARHCDRYNRLEGLQKRSKGKHWRTVVVTFLLTVIYLPMSIMAIHVLVWSDDLWVVPNPYVNATSFPPVVAPLGPTSEYRDPLDFCWTTTMKKDEINYAPVLIILSAIVVGMVSKLTHSIDATLFSLFVAVIDNLSDNVATRHQALRSPCRSIH